MRLGWAEWEIYFIFPKFQGWELAAWWLSGM